MSEPNQRPAPKSNQNPPAPESKAPDSTEPKTEARGVQPALTPEEQMALYEKELKENDWGHQPC